MQQVHRLPWTATVVNQPSRCKLDGLVWGWGQFAITLTLIRLSQRRPTVQP